jgi:hypothetical protein
MRLCGWAPAHPKSVWAAQAPEILFKHRTLICLVGWHGDGCDQSLQLIMMDVSKPELCSFWNQASAIESQSSSFIKCLYVKRAISESYVCVFNCTVFTLTSQQVTTTFCAWCRTCAISISTHFELYCQTIVVAIHCFSSLLIMGIFIERLSNRKHSFLET